jgi:Zn-dependent protease
MSLEQGIFLYVVVILSAIIHEYAHGWMAYQQGDPTAKYAGRLTLNPLAHIDIWGTVLMPLMLLYFFRFFFGYAKPVPINPNNFRNQRRGLIYVSIAGVAANFLIAVILGLGVRFGGNFAAVPFLSFIVLVNIWLGLFNLLPVPPLDGSKLLFGLISGRGSSRALDFLEGAGSVWGIVLALILAVTFLPFVSGLLFALITGGTAGF